MNYPVECWECSQGGEIITVPIGEFDDHNLDVHSSCFHTCEKCPNKFHCFEDMKAHQEDDHKKYPCLECHRRYGLEYFFDDEDMKRHFGKEHPKAKIKCKYCPNQFLLQRTCDRHMSMFHGHELLPEKIQCVNCDYSGYSLEEHNHSKHREMKYKCAECTNVFKTISLRDRHICCVSDSDED